MSELTFDTRGMTDVEAAAFQTGVLSALEQLGLCVDHDETAPDLSSYKVAVGLLPSGDGPLPGWRLCPECGDLSTMPAGEKCVGRIEPLPPCPGIYRQAMVSDLNFPGSSEVEEER